MQTSRGRKEGDRVGSCLDRELIRFDSAATLLLLCSPSSPPQPVYKQVLSTGVEDAKRLIEQDIKTHDVFVYMKGSPAQPKCGFSANVCRILNTYPGVKYGSRDVLEDEYIREGIKQFSSGNKNNNAPLAAHVIADEPFGLVPFSCSSVPRCSLCVVCLTLCSDWPTLPQLFVKGEFVGGSDIVGNMYKSGELDKLLGVTRNQA